MDKIKALLSGAKGSITVAVVALIIGIGTVGSFLGVQAVQGEAIKDLDPATDVVVCIVTVPAPETEGAPTENTAE